MKKRVIIIGVILMIAMVVFFNRNQLFPMKDSTKKTVEQITQQLDAETTSKENTTKSSTEPVEDKEHIKDKKIMDELRKTNDDVIAMLSIPDTEVYYPVVQAEDNDFYLRRNLKKEHEENGSIFMDYEDDVNESTNLIIYGHNMENDNMFSHLLSYKDKKFFDSHRDAYLSTDKERIHFTIIGAYLVDLTNEAKFFNFNTYINANEDMDSIQYLEEMKKLALYTEDMPIKKDQRLLTLSTCSYESKDARLVIVGVETKK